MATNGNNEVTGWVGWIYFAGFLMLIMGVLQIISGLAALLNDTYFLVRNSNLVVFDFTQWGWIMLTLGLVVSMAGSAVVNGRTWGRVVGVLLAGLSLVANFTFVAAYPIWSIMVMVVDILIIYALLVHGNEAKA